MPKFPHPQIVASTSRHPYLSIDPAELAKLITGVAQNNLAFREFSPDLINQLRRTMEIEVFKDQLVRKAITPYLNEIVRRQGQQPQNFKEVYGFDIDLVSEGITIPKVESRLETLADAELIEVIGALSEKVEADFKRDILANDLFLDIGLSSNPTKRSSSNIKNAANAFDLTNARGQLDANAVYWMFATFLRESEVRLQLERLAHRGVEPLVGLARLNRMILLVSAYPELLPIFESLAKLDFNPHIHFRFPDMPLETSYSRVKNVDGLLASFFVEKAVLANGRRSKEYLSTAGITLVPENPTGKGYMPFASGSIPLIVEEIGRAWQGFSYENKSRVENLDFEVELEGDSIEFLLKFEAGKNPPVDVLADFYLFMTEPEKRDERGHLFERTLNKTLTREEAQVSSLGN